MNSKTGNNPEAKPFVPRFTPPPPPPPPPGEPTPLQRAKNEIFTLREENTFIKQRNAELAESLWKATTERDQAIVGNTALVGELEKSFAENAVLRTQLDQVTGNTTQLRTQLEEALAKLKRKDGYQARADSTLRDLRHIQTRLQEERDQALARNATFQLTIEHMQTEFQAIRVEHDQAIDRNTALQGDLHAITEIKQGIQVELEATIERLRAITLRSSEASFTFDTSHVLAAHKKLMEKLLQDLESDLIANRQAIKPEYSAALFGGIQKVLNSIHFEMGNLLIAPQLCRVPVISNNGQWFDSMFDARLATIPLGSLTLPPTAPSGALAAAIAAAKKAPVSPAPAPAPALADSWTAFLLGDTPPPTLHPTSNKM
jgi:hypothetical protein